MTTPGERPVSLWRRLRPLLSVVIAVLGGVTYGLFTRLAFGKSEFSDIFTTLSLGFLCLTPLALGVITVLLAPPPLRRSWLYAVFGPWLGSTMFMLLVAAFTLEAWICILMAVPIFWVMSTIGGVVTRLALVEFSARNQTGMMGLLVLTLFAPYVVTPIEQTWPAPDSFRRVESAIEINAEPAAVWANITRFPRVAPSETRVAFFSLAGLPRPLEATLTAEGVGAIRRGEWEYGLAFVGTITDWQPERGFTLTLEADAGDVRGAPLPLGDIGGRYFDVVDDQYLIEPLGAGRVRLHLVSTHRLSTHFNAYGGLWTDLLMRDLQHYILRIVKERSEAQS